MALDKFEIGNRIRKIREEIFKEKRKDFALRCDLTERHIGQIERGDLLLSTDTLDKIASCTGIDIENILYGEKNIDNLSEKDMLNNIIDNANSHEIKMYYEIITTIRNYTSIKE